MSPFKLSKTGHDMSRIFNTNDSTSSFGFTCTQSNQVGTTPDSTGKRKNVSATIRLADVTKED